MIEGKIIGSRKDIEWMKREFFRNPNIRILRISRAYPLKDADGKYCINTRYERKECFKKPGKKKKK